jgi:DNA repair protein RadC
MKYDIKPDIKKSEAMLSFYNEAKKLRRQSVRNQHQVEEKLAFLHLMPEEEAWCLFLDNQNGIIESSKVGSGSADHCAVYPQKVFRRALEVCATSIILAHNHPAMTTDPSDADWKLTHRLQIVGEALGIELMDHIIFYGDGVTSMRGLREWNVK